MAIACAHCNGEHTTPAEVKRCWQGLGGGASDPGPPADPGPSFDPDPSFDPSTDEALPVRYDPLTHAAAKRQNKRILQNRFGLISDPELDDSCDMNAGLVKARGLILQIAEMGLPTATEMLEPITPQYLADLVCWSAIGARTTESQTHREMASGLSMPVGFKNGTDGKLSTAINALVAAHAAQTFLGIDQDGRTCVVRTGGNPYGHIVLRGGSRPNYDPISIEEARLMLITKGLPEAIIVDCSHANSHKKYQGQAIVWRNVIDQIVNGSESVIGLMLESNLHEGNQKYTGDKSALKYGVSITDECISWETTEELLLSAHAKRMQTAGATFNRAS